VLKLKKDFFRIFWLKS